MWKPVCSDGNNVPIHYAPNHREITESPQYDCVCYDHQRLLDLGVVVPSIIRNTPSTHILTIYVTSVDPPSDQLQVPGIMPPYDDILAHGVKQ